jgi:tetratricopeptide (TPR) repeat protein
MSNLANVLCFQGRLDEAEALYGRALAVQERTLGREHTQTLVSVTGVAWVLNAKGRKDEAEVLYRRVLEAQVRTLGREHPPRSSR